MDSQASRWEQMDLPCGGSALADAGMFTMATYFSHRRDYLLAWAKDQPDYDEYSTLTGGGSGGSQWKYWWMALATTIS